MAEQMTDLQLMMQERTNTGTAWTRNEKFEKDGYLVVKDLWDPEELYHPVPEQKGQYNYWDKNPEHFNHVPVESQVEGSTSRYWHPQYRAIHSGIRMKLEEIIGRKLYNTYYYDRFYYPGQELTKHADRDACEISVSVHVSTNLEGKDADKLVYDEHGMQLSAYAQGCNIDDPERVSIFVDRKNTETILFHIWDKESHEKHKEMFNSILRYWQLVKNYEWQEV